MTEILASAAVPLLFGIGVHIKMRVRKWERENHILHDITKEK
jgi:hypothetical protein